MPHVLLAWMPNNQVAGVNAYWASCSMQTRVDLTRGSCKVPAVWEPRLAFVFSPQAKAVISVDRLEEAWQVRELQKEKPLLRLWSSKEVEYLIVCLEDNQIWDELWKRRLQLGRSCAVEDFGPIELQTNDKNCRGRNNEPDKVDPGWKNMSQLTTIRDLCKQEKRKTTGGKLIRVISQPGLV